MVKKPVSIDLKGFLGYKHIKYTKVFDKTQFPICTTKEKEIGTIRKRVWYIHRLKEGWEIIQIAPKFKHMMYKTEQ